MSAPAEKAKSIFLKAVEAASDEERRAYLDTACGEDAALRREVEGLLAHHGRLGAFLESPAADPAGTGAFTPSPAPEAATGPVERPGTIIGPYKLLQAIGEGGMGAVFLAEQQEPVRRQVALKVIKPGMDSKQVLARFEAERQALALMDHPNIARVLDAGTTAAGRPYFVMELVKGVPLTRYCDEHRLTPRQRLELFVPVCQAIQHAHQKGIIHRDLKPSNVLVALYDDRPVPKVIDFGVAKATGQQLSEQTLQTGFGTLVGTLEYMSPEQAGFNQLDVDTRSDIYSLGVLLYELLTGSPPFTRKEMEQAGVLEVLRLIREQEPSKPSTKLNTAEGLPALAANRGTEPAKLTKLMRGELDWIVMKALEKDRARRYETVNGFAMDLQRYLADEPVQACPPSTRYRLAKFIRRNKASVTTAVVVFVVLLAGVLGTTIGLVRALQAEQTAVTERNNARAAEQQEREAKDEAERNLRQALKAADTFFTRVSESKLLDKPALHSLRKELLEEAQKHYLELFKRKPKDKLVKAELAASYLRRVFVLMDLDARVEALQELEKGVDLAEALIRDYPGDADVARCLAGVCKAERPTHRLWLWSGDDSEFMWTDRGTVARACGLWKRLADEHPAVVELQADYATLLIYQGVTQDMSDASLPEGKRERLRLCEQADAIFTRLARDGGLSLEHRISAVAARYWSAMLAWDEDNVPDAAERSVARAAQAQAMADQLINEFPDIPVLRLLRPTVQNYRATMLAGVSRRQEALQFCDQAVQEGLRLLAAEPDVPAHYYLLSDLYNNRSSKRGALAEEEADLRAAVDVAKKATRQFPDLTRAQRELATRSARLGNFLLAKQPKQALPYCEQAAAILEKLSREDSHHQPGNESSLRHCYFDIGQAQQALGHSREAEQAYQQVLRMDTRAIERAPNDYWSMRCYLRRAATYSALGEQDKALADLTTAIEHRPDWSGWWVRGRHYYLRQQWDKAAADFTRALQINPNRPYVWQFRADCYVRLQQWDKALADCRRLIEHSSDYLDQVVAWFLTNGRNDEADQLVCHAVAHFEQRSSASPAGFRARIGLARSYGAQGGLSLAAGKPHAAEPPLRKAIALYEALLVERAEPEVQRELDERYLRLSKVLRAVGKTEAADEACARVLASWRRQIEKDIVAYDQTWGLWVATYEPGMWDDIVMVYDQLATATFDNPAHHQVCHKILWELVNKQRFADAEKICRKRMALGEKTIATLGETPTRLRQLGEVLSILAWSLQHQKRSLEAAEVFRQDVAVKQKLIAGPESNPNDRFGLTQACSDWGTALLSAHKVEEAITAYRQGLAVAEKLVAEFPGESRYVDRVMTARLNLVPLLQQSDREQEAAEVYRSLLEQRPESAGSCNNLAWRLAIGADPKLRDPKRAVELAEKAVQLAPQAGTYWNTLGVAQYRAGNWKAAIEALNKSEEQFNSNELSFNAFFLAMAHWRLGAKEEARTWYDRAVAWMEKNKPQDEELRRFRAEAEGLLGIKKKAP
jgi:serine/threonine protein kinase/predicted Zn-dependent protease